MWSFEVKESKDEQQLCEVVFNITCTSIKRIERKIYIVLSYIIYIKPLDNKEREIYLYKKIQNTIYYT